MEHKLKAIKIIIVDISKQFGAHNNNFSKSDLFAMDIFHAGGEKTEELIRKYHTYIRYLKKLKFNYSSFFHTPSRASALIFNKKIFTLKERELLYYFYLLFDEERFFKREEFKKKCKENKVSIKEGLKKL